MKRTVKMKLVLLMAVLPLVSLYAKQPTVGSRAIDFSLNTFTGERLTLSDLRGKVVLLDFWASWCVPCREELPYLDLLDKTYNSKTFAVVAVNIDNDQSKAIRFLQQQEIKLNSLWDKKKKVVSAYDVATMPTTFLIDQVGRIRAVHSGFKTEQYQTYKKQIQYLLRQGKRKSNRRQLDRKNSDQLSEL